MVEILIAIGFMVVLVLALYSPNKYSINENVTDINKNVIDVGKIVKPTKESKYVLAYGNGWYNDAIVVSNRPFVLVSGDGNMRWEHTINKEDFEVIGVANEKTLAKVMRRLKD